MPALSIEARCQARTLLEAPSFSIRHVVCRRRTPERRYQERSAFVQLVIPVRGSFVHHARDGAILADTTKALFVHEGEKYEYNHLHANGDDALTFVLGQTLLDAEAPHFLRRVRADGHLELPLAGSMLGARLMAACRRGETLGAEESANTLLAGLLGFSSGQPRLKARDAVVSTKQAIAAHPERRWRLGELARRAGLSPFHLAREFRRAEGVTIHKYQEQLRMGEALARIIEGETSFTRLAFDLGYSGHSHFTSVFRRTYGIAPRHAREGLARGRGSRI